MEAAAEGIRTLTRCSSQCRWCLGVERVAVDAVTPTKKLLSVWVNVGLRREPTSRAKVLQSQMVLQQLLTIYLPIKGNRIRCEKALR